MSASVSNPATDFQPAGCIICADPNVGHGLLCPAHQGINALAAWVDQGLVGDWALELGSEDLNHRTMLIQPPLAPLTTWDALSLRDQLAIIVRRFSRWVGLDGGESEGREPPDPWAAG